MSRAIFTSPAAAIRTAHRYCEQHNAVLQNVYPIKRRGELLGYGANIRKGYGVHNLSEQDAADML